VHREAITHSQLNHPNILPFLGLYHENHGSPPVIVLPLVESGSLQDLLAGPLLEWTTFKRILVGVTSGVDYLHSRYPPVIHGDLHPACISTLPAGNVLVDPTGNPLLCDFGLSRIRHEVTRTHTILQEAGRLRYLAPELTIGGMKRFHTSSASDIFALAMMFLNTWSGQVPFLEVRNDLKVASNFRKGRRPDLPIKAVTLVPELRTVFWELLSNMWVQEPDDRPSSSDVYRRLSYV
ncbi:kinase-like protein, partial [Clavulina sp. PMI_390]